MSRAEDWTSKWRSHLTPDEIARLSAEDLGNISATAMAHLGLTYSGMKSNTGHVNGIIMIEPYLLEK